MNAQTMIPAQELYATLLVGSTICRDKAAALKGLGDTSTRLRALGAEIAFKEAAEMVSKLADQHGVQMYDLRTSE